MAVQLEVLLIDRQQLTVDELAQGCAVSREWVIARVEAGLLVPDLQQEPGARLFSGRELLRARRLRALERDFDANPEMAALAADLLEEIEHLRARLKRAGLSID